MPKSKIQQSQECRTDMRLQPSSQVQQRPLALRQPVASNEFTLEEHLWVQREIEERAYRFWSSDGPGTAGKVNHWLNAENEVVAEFVKSRIERSSAPSPEKPANTTTGTSPLLSKIPIQFQSTLRKKSTSGVKSSP